ncbi:MAG: hypothetical protein ACR2H4_00940 [Pyrinomonadaceae bacterium]
MKKLSFRIFTFVLIAASLASASAFTEVGQKTKSRTVPEKTIIGYISDASCGLQHMAGMDEKDCTLMCAKNGKFVLADRDHKLVYQLDRTGQEKAREFAGQKVKIKGRIVGKTIRVTVIEGAS